MGYEMHAIHLLLCKHTASKLLEKTCLFEACFTSLVSVHMTYEILSPGGAAGGAAASCLHCLKFCDSWNMLQAPITTALDLFHYLLLTFISFDCWNQARMHITHAPCVQFIIWVQKNHFRGATETSLWCSA